MLKLKAKLLKIFIGTMRYAFETAVKLCNGWRISDGTKRIPDANWKDVRLLPYIKIPFALRILYNQRFA